MPLIPSQEQEFIPLTDENHPGISDEDWKKLQERNLTPEEQAQKLKEELSQLKDQLHSLYERMIPYTNPKDMQLAKPPNFRDKENDYPYLFEKPPEGTLPDLWWGHGTRQPPGPSGPLEEVLGDNMKEVDPWTYQNMLMKLRRGKKNI